MLTVEIQDEDGNSIRTQAAGNLVLREFLEEYLRFKNKPSLDEHGHELHWTILDTRTNQALELGRTLNENRVADGQKLSIRCMRMALQNAPATSDDIEVEVIGPQGESHRAALPPDIEVEEFLGQLLQVFHLPDDKWYLSDPKVGKNLDVKKGLAANGVVTGQRLYLKPHEPILTGHGISCWKCKFENQAETRFCVKCGTDQEAQPDLELEVIGPDGTSHHTAAPADTVSGNLLADVIAVLQLPSATWMVVDQATGRRLHLNKTLGENKVVSGQRLLVQKRKGQGRAIALFAAALLLTAAIGYFLTHLPIAVTIEPKGPVSLKSGETQRFTATVSHAKRRVSWSINPPVGDISDEGTYTAPPDVATPTAVTVTARSVDDPAKIATAEVVLKAEVLSISPSSVKLGPGDTKQFSATEANVKWSLQPAVGTITQSGLYAAPLSLPTEQTVVVTAKSILGARSGTAIISLSNPEITSLGTSTLVPHTVSLDPGGRVQFSLTGATQPATIQWSISPPLGEISSEGIYTAPARIPQSRSVTITALAAGATAPVTARVILQAVTISIAPLRCIVGAGGRCTIQATIQHTPNKNVRCQTTPPGIGIIQASGSQCIYSAPPTLGTEIQLAVQVTSLADAAKTATTSIVVQPGVSVNPSYPRVMHESERWTFSVIDAWSPGTAVTFSAFPSSAGESFDLGRWGPNSARTATYTAPAYIPPGGRWITIMVRSNSDPSKFTTISVHLEPSSSR